VSSILDDLLMLMKLHYVSCEFDNHNRCEIKLATSKADTEHGITAQMYIQMSPTQVVGTMAGDDHSVHIKRA
jgi:hypothetical protein